MMAPLQSSLISSFVTAGLAAPESLQKLLVPYKQSPLQAELYIMMEPDAQLWAQSWNWPQHEALSAVEFLSKISPEETEDLAARLRKNYKEMGVTVLGIASFIPEVACHPDSEVRRRAILALSTLIRIARFLVAPDLDPKPVPVIEVVAGSCVESVVKENDDTFVDLMDDSVGCERVLGAIREALCNVLDDIPDLRATIGIELEPGPLFLLRDYPTLRQFAKAIEKDPLLRRYVGFNLDIAHWRLASIPVGIVDPESKVRDELIYERVVHSHIAGHHPHGHFGDIPLLEVNDPKDFHSWLRALKNLAGSKRNPELPPFSGCVSVEFEAAANDELVVKSVADLAVLLKESDGAKTESE